jgi:hypothetical protein
MDAGTIEVAEQACSFLMPAEAVPDEEEWALEMSAEVLDKGKDIVAGDVGGGDRKIEPHVLTYGRNSDGTGHGEALVTVPTIMDGCVPLGGPCPAHRRLEHEATLIEKDNGAALTPGFFSRVANLTREPYNGLPFGFLRVQKAT